MDLAEFDYDLPAAAVAQHLPNPAMRRGCSSTTARGPSPTAP